MIPKSGNRFSEKITQTESESPVLIPSEPALITWSSSDFTVEPTLHAMTGTFWSQSHLAEIIEPFVAVIGISASRRRRNWDRRVPGHLRAVGESPVYSMHLTLASVLQQ